MHLPHAHNLRTHQMSCSAHRETTSQPTKGIMSALSRSRRPQGHVRIPAVDRAMQRYKRGHAVSKVRDPAG